jgi:transposase
MIKSNKIQFKNQVFHLGIDAHKRDWRISIRTKGLLLKTFSMNPSPQELQKYMQRHYTGGTYRSVYEAGCCGYWIHRDLTDLGFQNIIVNPADVPSTHKEKDRKSDPIDSKKLARELENNSLSGIYIVNEEQEALRSFCRLYRQYAKRNSQIKNRIKGFLTFVGYKTPDDFESKYWSLRFVAMLKGISFKLPLNRDILDEHLDELDHIRKKQLALLRKLRLLGKHSEIIRLLRTVPGIGQISSFVLFAELSDIRRFKKTDTLCSYIGLVPSTNSSGDKERVTGISRRQNRILRSLLIEAAWIAVRNDPAMTAAYSLLIKRMTKQRAIIRITKKLLNRIRYVWLHRKPYVPAIVE